jgi:hypothetical protein
MAAKHKRNDSVPKVETAPKPLHKVSWLRVKPMGPKKVDITYYDFTCRSSLWANLIKLM